MRISIIIPSYNEEDSLPHLIRWIDRVMKEYEMDKIEVIVIDDGSSDKSWEVLEALKMQYPFLKAVRFRKNYGKSSALNMGFKLASGEVVITMDADLQDSPEEIPELVRMIREEGYDIVSGWKKERHDPLSKTIPTKLYNATTRFLSGISLHDMNCGLKAYHRDVIKNIHVYGEMHRYIPVIAKAAGFSKIGEKVVKHQARKYGKTKFGLERFVYGLLDLLSITFVSKFGRRPMHLFGSMGLLSFFLGFVILVYLSVSKIWWNETGIATRPLFFFGIITILLGAQLFLTGFLGELWISESAGKHSYQIRDTIDIDHA